MKVRILLLTSTMLAACGGGGGGGSVSTTTQNVITAPPSAAASCQTSPVIGNPVNDGLRIASVDWLQVVGQTANDQAMLVANKPTRIRVDMVANTIRSIPARRELRIQDPVSGECTLLSLNAPSRIPTAVDPSTMDYSFYADIPASLMKPGTRFNVFVNDASGRSQAETDLIQRNLTPNILPAVTETLYVVPISIGGRTGYVPSDTSLLAGALTRLHPISSVNIIMANPLTPSGLLSQAFSILSAGGSFSGNLSDMQSLLNMLDDHCHSLVSRSSSAASSAKCLGVFPDQLSFKPAGSINSFYTGLAFVGGITMLTQSMSRSDQMSVNSPYLSSHWMDDRALTIAHEYGHLLDLDHAACGGATGTDPRLYADGRLDGQSGFDVVRGVFFSSLNRTNEFADLMSYCGKEWTSDRGYLASMNYRSAARVASYTTANDQNWVKLTPSEDGWRLTKVDFTPSTLAPSDEEVSLSNQEGTQRFTPYRAVISDSGAEQNSPVYVNIGTNSPTALVLHANKRHPQHRWVPSDWLKIGG